MLLALVLIFFTLREARGVVPYEDPAPLLGLLRLVLALPFLLLFGLIVGSSKGMPRAVTWAIGSTTALLTLWMIFGAASSIHGEVPGDEHIELAITAFTVIAVLTTLFYGSRAARQSVEEVHYTLEGGLLGLGLALEHRDLETAGHTVRVVSLAARLGQALGLSSAELEALRQGAYLHDIGELAVPDAILLKPGELTDAEGQAMRSHSVRGYEIASQIPTLSRGGLEVIRYHHERWDGLGYPDGLRGEAIPLAARIFAVCDVFDALTSERPYKLTWTEADALCEIRAQAGRRFDTLAVEVFLTTHPHPKLLAEI